MIHTKKEQEAMIADMKAVSAMFYYSAVGCGNHAFIEFTGLMNEYITMCEQTVGAGEDFTECNTHVGKPLVHKDHNLRYLAEKLECIYGSTIRDAAIKKVEDGDEH